MYLFPSSAAWFMPWYSANPDAKSILDSFNISPKAESILKPQFKMTNQFHLSPFPAHLSLVDFVLYVLYTKI